MTENERMTVATRLYVRLRHHAARTTDPIWMTENADYAREILRLARHHGDPELVRLAERFESVMFGRPAGLNGSSHHDEPHVGEDGRYTGSLR